MDFEDSLLRASKFMENGEVGIYRRVCGFWEGVETAKKSEILIQLYSPHAVYFNAFITKNLFCPTKS